MVVQPIASSFNAQCLAPLHSAMQSSPIIADKYCVVRVHKWSICRPAAVRILQRNRVLPIPEMKRIKAQYLACPSSARDEQYLVQGCPRSCSYADHAMQQWCHTKLKHGTNRGRGSARSLRTFTFSWRCVARRISFSWSHGEGRLLRIYELRLSKVSRSPSKRARYC